MAAGGKRKACDYRANRGRWSTSSITADLLPKTLPETSPKAIDERGGATRDARCGPTGAAERLAAIFAQSSRRPYSSDTPGPALTAGPSRYRRTVSMGK